MRIPSVARTVGLTATLVCFLGSACGEDPPAEVSTPGVERTAAPVAPTPSIPTPPANHANPVVGDVVPAGEGSVAVLASERFGSAGRLFSPPRGKDYFAVETKACSGPEEAGLSFSPAYFLLEMTDGTVADPTLGIKRPELSTEEVPAGGCRSGWVTFVIPEEATPAGVVYDGSERLRWRIVEPAPDA